MHRSVSWQFSSVHHQPSLLALNRMFHLHNCTNQPATPTKPICSLYAPSSCLHDYDYEKASHSPALCPATLVQMADDASFSICLSLTLSFSLSLTLCSPLYPSALQVQLMTGRLIFNYKHIKCETGQVILSYALATLYITHTQHTRTRRCSPTNTRTTPTYIYKQVYTVYTFLHLSIRRFY